MERITTPEAETESAQETICKNQKPQMASCENSCENTARQLVSKNTVSKIIEIEEAVRKK
jgi:hypothetical protein